jgi:hypothetical protein
VPTLGTPPAKAKRARQQPRDLAEAVHRFGQEAYAKLSNPAVAGHPEDQIRTPVEHLIRDIVALTRPGSQVAIVGEAPLPEARTRPDFAITLANLLVGFVELKAPGKGADPRRFKDPHDRAQWLRLQSLPNLIYTDAIGFSLWRYGEPVGGIVELDGDPRTTPSRLGAPRALLQLFEDFLSWQPIPPKDARELAELCARLCRLLRDEVAEQLALNNRSLTAIARDWRKILFPDATDVQFADGYAQAVTFGMLMARAKRISLADGLDRTGQALGPTLIGTALRVLTFSGRAKLTTSIDTLIRVLDAVNWPRVSKGKPDAWLYFYEDFLAVYDNKLRKQTGSYYTPAEVVREMVRLIDELLRTRFSLADGLASSVVTLVDPAVGTGTFLLGVLQKIATLIEQDQGPGAVPAAIDAAVRRLIAFEIQLGPFAVAQLRVLAELTALIGESPSAQPRMFVADTLANPFVEQEWLPEMYEPIAESRREANRIKKHERVMVVLGNPPYREKAKGSGGWIESGDGNPDGMKKSVPPLDAWMPPAEWGVSAHSKHLRNLYVYFWRWATWKVFDHDPVENNGIVCFISVAGFLNGPGFQKMRDYLRRTTDEIWIIDCSPEGHQPDVATRLFEGVQQPVCIVFASRSPRTDSSVPAIVRYRALAPGDRRSAKFAALASISLDDDGWVDCARGWRDPFLPMSGGEWSSYVPIDGLFAYNGSGVMPGRTWVVAPDADCLSKRWELLRDAPAQKKEVLFHPHLRNNQLGDKHSRKIVAKGLPGYEFRRCSVADDRDACITPIRYAFRSFDRQWIIPDSRLINQPNPELWEAHSSSQVYLTALVRHSPTSGPAVSATGLIPDHDHYKGSFAGRVFPLWLDRNCRWANIRPGILSALSKRYATTVTPEDVFAYVACIAGQPAYTQRFRDDLVRPGLRVPITADGSLFSEIAELGRKVVWLHSFGERFANVAAGRPGRPPRLPRGAAPTIPREGAIGLRPDEMPDELRYEANERRLYVGAGYVDCVSPAVWNYVISGKQVIVHWFSYRKANRERPLIGERREPSPLVELQSDRWLAEYTTELMHLLNVLGCLVELEPTQAKLLSRVCGGKTISINELEAEGAFLLGEYPGKPSAIHRTKPKSPQVSMPWGEQR